MSKIDKRKLITYAILASLTLSNSGCNSKNNTKINSQISTEYEKNIDTEYITTEYATTEFINQAAEYNDIEYIEETTETSSSKDDEIISDFNSDKEEIEYYASEKTIDIELIKSKGKAFFIKCVDFIFYDSKINGITFNELTDEAKEDIYDTFCYIDSLIINIAPDYKENIEEKYQIAKDFTNKAYYASLNKIKEAINEENYNKIGEIKDSVKDTITSTTKDVKIKVKNWYEDFKEN